MFSSVWRSLLPVVEDNPFALLDPFSVLEEDLVETDRVSPISLGRMYNVKYNQNQKWYWLSKQTSEEAVIFVCFDSHPPNGILNCKSIDRPFYGSQLTSGSLPTFSISESRVQAGCPQKTQRRNEEPHFHTARHLMLGMA